MAHKVTSDLAMDDMFSMKTFYPWPKELTHARGLTYRQTNPKKRDISTAEKCP